MPVPAPAPPGPPTLDRAASSGAPAATEGAALPLSRRRAILWVLVAAQFIYVMDAFIVSIAAATIQRELGASNAEIQGMIVLYQVAFATVVVTGGRLGDLWGSKRVFLLGLAGFTLASGWCGLVGSGSGLVLARVAQGAAAALMVPQVMRSIHLLFEGEERGRAIGIYGFTLGLGGIAGFGLGGLILALDVPGLGWRLIFMVNLPIGLVLGLAAWCWMPDVRGARGQGPDLLGSLWLGLSLVALLGALLTVREAGWPLWLMLVFVLGGAGVLSFGWVERRVEQGGRLPLVPQALFEDRAMRRSLGAVFWFTFANQSFYFVLTMAVQRGLGAGSLAIALAILPLGVAFAVVSRAAGPRVQRLGVRALQQGGLVQLAGLAALALWWLLAAGPGVGSMLVLAAVLTVFGIGQGMVMAPLFGRTLVTVPARHAGSGSGVLSIVQQVGNATGLSILGSLFLAQRTAIGDLPAFLAVLLILAAALGLMLRALARDARAVAQAAQAPASGQHAVPARGPGTPG